MAEIGDRPAERFGSGRSLAAYAGVAPRGAGRPSRCPAGRPPVTAGSGPSRSAGPGWCPRRSA
ncbi:hypothetical protein ACWDU3_30620 [Streptomyces olivaceus]